MARLVYACRFDVPGELAWETVVRPRYQRWISDWYLKNARISIGVDLGAGAFSGVIPDGHVLVIRRFEAGDVATELEWSFPGTQGLIWRNVIRSAQLGDRCAVEHRVQIASAEYLVSPTDYTIGAPTVVRVLCAQDVLVGDMRLRATVYPLVTDGMDQFLLLLKAEARRLPIVLLTPFANGERGDLDARALADHLAGVAIVTEADAPGTTRLLSDRIGKMGCYDGGVRVYWPRFRPDDDLRRHPLLLSSRIAALGAERAARMVERSIFSVAAVRFTPIARIDAIIARSESSARAERAQEAVGSGDSTWETYALEMSEKLDLAQDELASSKAENENLRANQNVMFAFSTTDEEADTEPVDVEPTSREPSSVTEAVAFAAEDCSRLNFLESSRVSAASSPFKRPEEIYRTLSIMDKVAEVWVRNEGGGDLRQMFRDAGLGKRVSYFISQTSKGKWGDDYTFTYEGGPRLFEPHVTIGAGSADTCASIHFLPDKEKGQIAIAHVGKHLTNTKS